MKLGVSFNIFSGLELLKPSIMNIRAKASYVVGVYSVISSAGDPCAEYLQDLISDLLKDRLLDEAVLFTPKITSIADEMILNHKAKREVGKSICWKKGCSHFMAKDCDEFYLTEQIEKQWKVLETYDVCLAPLIDYIRSPLLRASVSILHLPVCHKINLNYEPCHYPVLVDQGRMVKGRTIKVFSASDLSMHHFSSVRINEQEMLRKRQGHSCYNRMTESSFKESVRDSVQSRPVKEISDSNLTKVGDIFNIVSYWEGEFQRYLK